MKAIRRRVFDIAHVGMHSHVAALNPTPRSGPPPTNGGIPFGWTDDSGAVTLNQLEQHATNLTGGTSGLIIAFRGSGKTATLKKMAFHESALMNQTTKRRRRVSVDDTRLNTDREGKQVPEYQELVESLGGQHADLSGYKINILDHRLRLNPEQQHDLLLALCEVIKGDELNPAERTALTVGIGVMRTEAAESTSVPLLQQIMARLTYRDYDSYSTSNREAVLRMINDDMQRHAMKARLDEGLNTAPVIFTNAAHSVSFLLNTLLSGYDGIFGAEHELYDVLTRPVVGLNLTKLSATTIPMVEMALWAIRAGTSDLDIAADFEMHDENWARWSSLVYGTNMVRHLKHIRGKGTRIWRAMHRLSDVDQVGPAGSQEREKALTALKETDIVFVGRMPRVEHERLQETFREIPRYFLNQLPSLEPGRFLVLIGEIWAPFMMQVRLTTAQMTVGYTDYARDMLLGKGLVQEPAETEEEG